MGEYYKWVNIDKHEYLSPGSFDLGNKLYESSWPGTGLLRALYTLLSSDWKGDSIVFLGDYTNLTYTVTNPVLKRLYEEHKASGIVGYDSDYVEVEYKDISYRFKEGNLSFFRYAVNHTKKEFFDVEKTRYYYKTLAPYTAVPVQKEQPYNPLPVLMVYSYETIEYKGKEPVYEVPYDDKYRGLWLGDTIEVTDFRPPVEYMDKSGEYCLYDDE